MTTDPSIRSTSNAMLWTGRVLSAIPVLLMAGLGTVLWITKPGMVTDNMIKYGYPPGVGRPLMVVEIVCALLYAIPRTAVLGAILLTGYLGGAVATHVHAHENFVLPVAVGVVVWLGLYFRDARIRALVPMRK